MPKVLKNKNVEKVKDENQNYFSVNEDARFVRRLDVVSLICDGHTTNYVSGLFRINSTTIQRWIHRLNESGFQGLRDMQGRGLVRCQLALIPKSKKPLKKIKMKSFPITK